MTVHRRHSYCKEVFRNQLFLKNGKSESSPLSFMGSSETTVSSDKETIKIVGAKVGGNGGKAGEASSIWRDPCRSR